MSQETSRTVATERIETHLWEAGAGHPVIFVHGNLSAGAVWREQLGMLPDGVRGIAPDLRGFGESEPAPIDATRGLGDFADDLVALLDALGLDAVHLVDHSMGGGAALCLAAARPRRVRSVTLVAPVSPYGFGGTRADGTPNAPDYAGSGGGTANPDLVRLLGEQDRTAEHPVAPRNVIRSLFFPSPEAVRDENALLEQMLRTRLGDWHYPGDAETSRNWPGMAPGRGGVLNAMSPRYCDLTTFAESGCTAPVLWVRGDQDMIVSDASLVDVGHLGAIGAIPDWPGVPAQPMIGQTRQMLEAYAARGGRYREQVLAGVGHFPFTQRPEEFAELLDGHLQGSRAGSG